MNDIKFDSQEKIFFSKISNSLSLDEKTKEKSSQYFLNYKQNHKDGPFDFKTIIACCVFISAKSQIVKTLEGQFIRGIGISINQIIKISKELSEEKFSLKDFLFQLKIVTSKIHLDSEIQNIMKDAIKRFVFIHLFHCKFTEILNSFLIQNNEEYSVINREDDDYLKKGKDMAWLLFIVLQNLLFEANSKDVGPNACLLLSVLYELLSTLPEKFYMKAVLNDSLLVQETIDNTKLIRALCQEMKIKDIDVFHDFYEKQFKEQLNWLSRQENIVISRENTINFEIFKEEYITYNYNKLDQFYQKNIGFDNIDERLFLVEKSLQTVTKILPFTPLPKTHPYSIDNNLYSNSTGIPRKSFLKNLNFDTAANNDFSLHSTLSDLRNKKYPESPSLTPLDKDPNPFPLAQTPISQQIELYNWLCECIKKVKPNKDQEYSIPSLQKYIEMFEKENLKSKIFALVDEIIKKIENNLDKNQQIFYLYLRVLDEMIRIEDKKLEEKNLKSQEYYEFVRNLDFHRSLIAICIETIFFINNKELDLQNLFTISKIEPFDFWKMINSFVKFDKKMPLSLKEHFLIIEKMIIFGFAWKAGSSLDKLIKNFEEKSKNDTTKSEKADIFIKNSKLMIKTEIFLNRSEEVFFKKVIYYTAAQILDVCEMLGLNEKITENVWQTITFILSNETRLIINRNINHLIICGVYAICKNDKIKLNFDGILKKYKNFPHIKDHNEFSRKIELDNGENGDIIKFYNEIFIPAVRNFIKTLKTTTNNINSLNSRRAHPHSEIKRPMVPMFSIQSPIRETLNFQYNHPMSVNNKIYSSNLMTPLTKTLYAFGESLESPQKNYLDFQQKILKNPRMLKKIDFDNNELVNNHNNHIKNENQSEDYKLKIRPQFFNFKKNENKNLRNISNFNDEGLVQEKNGNASEKKNNLTPEFKK